MTSLLIYFYFAKNALKLSSQIAFRDDREAKYLEIKLLHDSQKHLVKQREVQKSDVPNINVPAFALGIFNNNNKRLKSIEMIAPGEMNGFKGYSKDSLQLLDCK